MRLAAMGQRKRIPRSEFGLGKAPGVGSSPFLPDKAHAVAALHLLHNASPTVQGRVKKRILSLWPSLSKKKS